MSKPVLDFTALTPDQRLELIGQLWDSLDDVPPLSPEQLAELERRSAELDARPDDGLEASEAVTQLRNRLR